MKEGSRSEVTCTGSLVTYALPSHFNVIGFSVGSWGFLFFLFYLIVCAFLRDGFGRTVSAALQTCAVSSVETFMSDVVVANVIFPQALLGILFEYASLDAMGLSDVSGSMSRPIQSFSDPFPLCVGGDCCATALCPRSAMRPFSSTNSS